ncbi:MAG TPA: hypothetical protein VLK25_01515 [Allosphingosinicella sp.]|nr:hypothetical protein [Allosphingosinicella sp.]
MRKSALFIAFLCLSPAAAFAQTATPSGEAEVLAQFRTGVERMRAEMLRPGERLEGWDHGGADPDTALRALGADRFYQLNRTVDGTGVTILTDRPIRDFAPAAWRVVDSYGAANEPLDHPQVDFLPFSERYVIASRSTSFRQNDAGCFRNLSHALLYEIPSAPATAEDANVPMLFRMLILAMDGQTICVRMDGDREHGWRSRYFLPDGRALPTLTDANDLLTIVPAAPLESLVRANPPRATTTD